MPVNVSLPLFGNAGHELEEGQPLQPAHLRNLAEEMNQRLIGLADLIDRLKAHGWTATTAMYDAILTHPQVKTRQEAEKILKDAGIDPAQLMILEEIEENDEEAE